MCAGVGWELRLAASGWELARMHSMSCPSIASSRVSSASDSDSSTCPSIRSCRGGSAKAKGVVRKGAEGEVREQQHRGEME